MFKSTSRQLETISRKVRSIRWTLETKRISPAEFFIDWLNEPEHAAATSRMLKLIKDTQHVLPLIRNGRAGLDKLLPISKAITRYRSIPEISTSGLWREKKIIFTYGRSPDKDREWAAFSMFSWLTEQGEIEKLRQCDWAGCRRWYFAKFSHQRFCKTNCKLKHKSSTPEFKKHRRDYMRRYYKENFSR